MTDKPDPSDVEAVSDTEGVYQRDSEGNLTASEWHVIEYNDQYKKVKPYPIPIGELQKFEEMGDDINVDKLCDILADKFATPDRSADEWRDTDPQMFMSCVNLLVKIATGEEPSNEFHAEVREELSKRDGQTGNSTA